MEVLLIFNLIFYLCQRYTLTASKVLFHHIPCRCISLLIFLGDYFLNVFWRSDNKIGDSFRLTSLMNFLLAVTTVSTVEWWILFFFSFFVFVFFFNCHRKTLKQLSSNFLVKTIVEQIELLKVLIKIKSFMLNINIRPVENYILHKNEMSFFRENNYFFFLGFNEFFFQISYCFIYLRKYCSSTVLRLFVWKKIDRLTIGWCNGERTVWSATLLPQRKDNA